MSNELARNKLSRHWNINPFTLIPYAPEKLKQAVFEIKFHEYTLISLYKVSRSTGIRLASFIKVTSSSVESLGV